MSSRKVQEYMKGLLEEEKKRKSEKDRSKRISGHIKLDLIQSSSHEPIPYFPVPIRSQRKNNNLKGDQQNFVCIDS